jgi:1,3-beta-glucanosyltransferase GAS5
MSLLADAGIYLAVDVTNSKYSLNRENQVALAASYNDVFLQSVFATIDTFARYDNTLLFFAGNEVISKDEETWAAPYIKAVIRDMKQYIKARIYRTIPVGYSATDLPGSNIQLANYMNCGPDEDRADFTAFNDYSWCGPQDFDSSSWGNKTKIFSNYSIPLL